MNLGWRLAAVARGDADPTPLDAYHDERHPIGEQPSEHTMAQSVLISATTPAEMALRSLLGGLIADVPEFSLALARKHLLIGGLSDPAARRMTGPATWGGFSLPQRAVPGRTALPATVDLASLDGPGTFPAELEDR